jgi:hypothetical protein
VSAEVRLGRWQDVLADVEPGTIISDPPYGSRTHAGDESARSIRTDNACVTAIDFPCWTRDDVHEFCASWLPRSKRWLVAMTSHDLVPHWEAAIADAGWYGFAPLAAVISGMGVRQLGDGPASWVIHLVVARRRAKRLGESEDKIWRSLPGGYTGPATAGMAGGRGKPPWLLDALVRDYSDEGHLICDPFAGWGSTLVAARNAGRDAFGAEMDPAAHARCEAALAGDRAAFNRLGPKREREPDLARPGLFDAIGGAR